MSAEIAKRDEGMGAMVAQYREDFAQVLPVHIKSNTFVRLAQGLLRRDRALAAAAERNPGSFMAALLDCARLGHEPGTSQYALVAFGSEVTGIEQYTGKVERMYRAGAVASVKAEVVREHDTFRYSPSRDAVPFHEIDWESEDRGKLRLVYAYAVMKDGATSRVVVLNRAQVMQHKALSRGADKPTSPWVKWEESMWLKTGAHELEKWVPTSSEYLRDQARAAGEMLRVANQPAAAPAPATPPAQAPEPIQVVDAEVVEGGDEEWPNIAPVVQ